MAQTKSLTPSCLRRASWRDQCRGGDNREKAVKLLSNVVRALSRFMYSIAGVALTAMMLLTVADVILRFLGRPIVGTYEVVGLLGAVVIGFAIPQTSRLKGHVLMDFLTDRLPHRAQAVLQVATRILACALFVIIGWNIWLLGDGYRQTGEVTLTIQLPLYPVAYGIAVCCFIQCLVLIMEILEMGKQGAE